MRIWVFLAVLFAPAIAAAAPLSLADLASLESYVSCEEACGNGRKAAANACLAACGATSPAWEKNQVAPIDRSDLDLARLEYWDGGALSLICYQSNAVLPIAQCGVADCLKTHTQADCVKGADGLFAWQRTALGVTGPQTICHTGADCGVNGAGAFNRQCVFSEPAAVAICRDRAPGSTAFHIEAREINDQEVLAYVYFDYSPSPTTILDLYIDYDPTALQLTEARPLDALVAAGKDLAVRQVGGASPSQAALRLVAFSASSSTPIPNGVIAEILFHRIAATTSSLAFSSDVNQETQSMAGPPGGPDYRGDLANASLWGTAVNVPASGSARLIAQYSFDDPTRPLSYVAVPSGDALCQIVGECVSLDPNADATKAARAKKVAELTALQRGVALFDGQTDGVSAKAALFNGSTSHLELPISVNGPDGASKFDPKAQQLSFSTWFYAEAPSGSDQRQLVFSHNNFVEKTASGLYLTPSATGGTLDLVWFEGDYRATTAKTATIATGIATRTWTHLGLSADPATGSAAFYVNGDPKGSVPVAQASLFACPAVDPQNAARLKIHSEGDYPGGHSPQTLFYATTETGLYNIQQLDMRTFTERSVVSLPNASAETPSYSPVVDKIVYSSNSGGDYEIWIANGDGSGARAITSGFGGAAGSMFARRPRWAPDASGVVFESNAYSLPSNDNLTARTYHLYYVPFDTAKNDVAVPVPNGNGATVNVLDYPSLAAIARGPADPSTGATPNEMDRFRLGFSINHNESTVLWLRGANPAAQTKGDILYTSSDSSFKGPSVYRLTIPSDLLTAQPSAVSVTLPSADGAEVSAIAAFHAEPAGQPVATTALLREAWTAYAASSNYAVSVQDGGNQITATVSFVGGAYDAQCWDTNRNKVCDPDENKSGAVDGQGNPVCSVADCYPSEISNLYVQYDSNALKLVPEQSGPTPSLGPQGLNKKVEVLPANTISGTYVRVGVTSPTNDTPLPAKTDIARLVFAKLSASAPTLAAVERSVTTQLALLDLEANSSTPFTIEQSTGGFSELIDAAFSPEGDRLALSVIQQARPTLLLTKSATTSAGAAKILAKPTRVEGLSWARVERYYPCNWVGAYRDNQSGFYAAALHGAVDEVKVYNYVRTADAFRSEAQRGQDALKKAGLGGQLPSPTLTCNNDSLQCPAYHVCQAGQCVVATCNPSDPYSCSTGQCTLAAVSDATGRQLGWVCSAECDVDNQCFRQQCMNGPCRFCDAKLNSCSECRNTVQDFGAFKIDTVEGCPDQNSYSCQAGSCVTECYANVNGKSKYLCDPATEYCKRGKCTLLDWDWKDLSPMTFSGVGETVYLGPNPTVASSTLFPVEIEAYGQDDYNLPPEILVEAKSGMLNGGRDWFELGRVTVYNLTRVDAKLNHYVLQTPYPLSAVRLRLVTPPLANLNAASTGFGARAQDFCHPSLWANGTPPDDCTYRASGSRPNVGYPLGIGRRDELVACAARGGCNASTFDPLRAPAATADAGAGAPGGAPVDHLNAAPWPFADLTVPGNISGLLGSALADMKNDPAQPYLASGQPTVVISNISVAGTSFTGNLSNDLVCSYEGTLDPTETVTQTGGATATRRKRIWFGDVSKEMSNQKKALFPSAPASTLLQFPALQKGWALLNCNIDNPTTDSLVAGVTITIDAPTQSVIFRPKAPAAVKETANGCLVSQGGTYVPCYEMVGGDAVLDVMSTEGDLYKTLELNTYRSFGYPMESDAPTYDCRLSTPDAGADATPASTK
jgi:hypothetical protein